MSFFEKRPLCVSFAAFIALFIISAGFNYTLKIIALCATVLAFLIVLAVKRKINALCGVLIACCAASLLSLFYFNVIVSGDESYIGFHGRIFAEIDKVSYSSDFASYAVVTVTKLDGTDAEGEPLSKDGLNIRAKLNCSYNIGAKRGDVIEFEGTFTALSDDEDGFDEKRYYKSLSVFVGIDSTSGYASVVGKAGWSLSSFFVSVNEFCSGRLSTLLSGGALGIAKAIFLGDKSGLPRSFLRDFRRIGLSHMLAVSGLHLSVLLGGIYRILKRLYVSLKARTVIIILICLFYMGLTGAPPSIVRSGIMFIILSLAELSFRFNDPVTSLFTAGALMILFNPSAIFDTGFLLSFTATFGILAVSPKIQKYREKSIEKRGAFIRSLYDHILSPAVITFSAVAFTLPVSVAFFGSIYILSPLTNFLFSPVISISLLISPMLVLASYIPFVGPFLAFVFSKLSALIIYSSAGFAGIDIGNLPLNYPFVGYLTIGVVACTAILLFIKLKNEMWYTVPFAVFIAAYLILRSVFLGSFDRYSYVACINDSKNDAICVYDEGKTTLIDISSGKRSFVENCADLLGESFYRDRIDRFVVTHYHSAFVKTFDRLTDERYVGSVLFVFPENDTENAYFETLLSICEKKGLSYSVYDAALENEASSEIYILRSYIKRSTHPVTGVRLNSEKQSFQYVGKSYGEICPKVEADIVFFGSHGPVEKEKLTDYSCKAAVYPNVEYSRIRLGSYDESMVISDGDGFIILRIKK